MNTQSAVRSNESVAMRVLEAVADARDVDPVALHPPLGTVVDPDALDTLAGTDTDGDVAIQFTYADCRVSVTNDGVVARDLTDVDA